MKTCKTCRFWSQTGHAVVGICDRINCYFPKDTEEQHFDIFAEADDDQGLHADLRTGCNFGCVLYEEKPQKKD